MSGSTARRIEQAAGAILATEGSDQVSIRRIASAIGVTPMTIYRHYADRSSLLDDVASHRFEQLAQTWQRQDVDGPTDELIVYAMGQLLEFALTDPHVYDYLFLKPRSGARTFPSEVAKGESPTFSILTALIRQGMDEGQFAAADPVEVGFALSAVIHGMVALQRGGRISYSQDEFRSVALRAVRRMLDGLRPPVAVE